MKRFKILWLLPKALRGQVVKIEIMKLTLDEIVYIVPFTVLPVFHKTGRVSTPPSRREPQVISFILYLDVLISD